MSSWSEESCSEVCPGVGDGHRGLQGESERKKHQLLEITPTIRDNRYLWSMHIIAVNFVLVLAIILKSGLLLNIVMTDSITNVAPHHQSHCYSQHIMLAAF